MHEDHKEETRKDAMKGGKKEFHQMKEEKQQHLEKKWNQLIDLLTPYMYDKPIMLFMPSWKKACICLKVLTPRPVDYSKKLGLNKTRRSVVLLYLLYCCFKRGKTSTVWGCRNLGFLKNPWAEGRNPADRWKDITSQRKHLFFWIVVWTVPLTGQEWFRAS